jgi:hypothetical protein
MTPADYARAFGFLAWFVPACMIVAAAAITYMYRKG